jgi:hypothetical protein
MFVTIDAHGTVAICTIVKVMIVYRVTRHVAIDPNTSYHHQFYTMAARFSSQVHGKSHIDALSMLAVGCRDSVLIFDAKQNDHKELLSITKPDRYFSQANQSFDPFIMYGNPALTWGYGMSPLLKDKPHSMLAIAWGPII